MAWGQEENPVRWALTEQTLNATAGTTLRVGVTATIDEGWHLYSLKPLDGGPIPTRITLPEGQPFTLAGAIEAPPPLVLRDDVFEMDVEYYNGSAEFTLPVKPSAPGRQKLRIAARYQTCNDKICLPPRTVTLETTVQVK
jgi:thiol:disulfide interchange protein DsbD